jgi:acylphosphatase
MVAEGGVARTLTAIVSGRVQGVGFRFFVKRNAGPLRLRGWARNLPSGDVEVVVSGAAEDVQALLALFRVGRTPGRVSNVAEDWSPRDDLPAGFEIR